MKNKYADAGSAVVAFLREELEARYSHESVRRIKELKNLDPEVLEKYRAFVLGHIYPEGEARAEIDAAFGGLHEVFLSPRKMVTLGSLTMSSYWRIGRRLTSALSAGRQLAHTYFCSSEVEAVLRRKILEQGWPWKSGVNRREMQGVFADLPGEPFNDLIEALVELLKISADKTTMETGLDYLGTVDKAMDADPRSWTTAERRGISLARESLGEALQLFELVNEKDVPRFIHGVESVERHWLWSMRGKK